MTVTAKWGMQYQALLDVGFQQNVFKLGGYATTTTRTNLIANPSVETNDVGWTGTGTAAGSNSRSSTYSYAGGWSYLRSTTGSGTASAAGPTVTGLTAGRIYACSAFMRSSVAKTGRLDLNFYNSSGAFLVQATSTTVTTSVSGWTRYTVIASCIAGADRLRMFPTITNALTGEDHYFDAYLVEDVTELFNTAWSSNPDLNPNSGFEVSTTGWVSGGTASATLARTTSEFYSGVASMSVTTTGSGTARAFYSGGTTAAGSVLTRIPVTGGKTYSLSAFVKSASVSRISDVVIIWYDSAGAVITGAPESGEISTSTTEWKQTQILGAVAPDTATSCTISVRFQGVSAGEVHYIDVASFKETPVALPYFDGTTADPYTGYTLLDQAWNGTANNSTTTATWGLNSSIYGSTLGGPDALNGVTSFVDITQYVKNININRGRSSQLDVFSPGTLTIQANDQQANRAFDPLNEASPWYQGNLGIAPRRRVKVLAGTADIYSGYIYDLDIIYDQPDLSFAQITAVDALAQISQTTLNEFTPSAEFASDRMNTILDRPEVGLGTAVIQRDINQSVSSVGTVAYEAGENTLKALQEIQIGENGRFFATRSGVLRFDPRVTASVATAVATLGGTAVGAIPINGLENVYGAETVVNRVSVQIAGSTAVSVAEGTASQALYGVRSLAFSDLPLETDAAGSALARSLVDQYQNPEVRFTGVSVNLNSLSSAQQDTMAGIEIGDVLVISKEFAAGSPTTVNKTVVVEAVRHTISANQHNVSLSVAPFTALNLLILGDPEFGTLSTTNALGSRVFADFVMDVSELDSGYTFT